MGKVYNVPHATRIVITNGARLRERARIMAEFDEIKGLKVKGKYYISKGRIKQIVNNKT